MDFKTYEIHINDQFDRLDNDMLVLIGYKHMYHRLDNQVDSSLYSLIVVLEFFEYEIIYLFT
jgi:hypothetical protein